LLDRRFGLFAIFQTVGDVAGDGEILKQRVGLEHDAKIALCRRQGGNVATILLHRAMCLNVQPRNRPQQRGLAAAGGAEEADELAPVNIDVDVVEGGEVAEALREVADAKIGRGHGRSIC